MRVISGSARGTVLKTMEGMNTRPTTDRIKETLFNMIHSDLYDCMFLDLFSGSGAIGIEALSRGAKKAWFVENNRTAVNCIRDNIRKTHMEEKAVVMDCDVNSAISRLKGRGELLDFVFMDPPYEKGLERQVLEALRTADFVDEYTTIIVEASMETEFGYLEELGYEAIKVKEYKTNKHMFIKKKS